MRVFMLAIKQKGGGQVDSNNPNVQEMRVRIKVVAAAIGTGLIVAMGALTIAFSGNEAHAVAEKLRGGGGGTSTQATPPSTMPTMAVPTQTAERWKGKGWPWQ
jgi:hypothetical protein